MANRAKGWNILNHRKQMKRNRERKNRPFKFYTFTEPKEASRDGMQKG